MNAEKFTQKTIETINTAQAMAQENQNQYLTPAHLLYALIDQDGGLIGSLLSKMGADCDAVEPLYNGPFPARQGHRPRG